MTKQLEKLSVSFPDQMLKALEQVIESPVMGARCHFNGAIYTTINQLQQFSQTSTLPFPVARR